jgi:hypothetical protein
MMNVAELLYQFVCSRYLVGLKWVIIKPKDGFLCAVLDSLNSILGQTVNVAIDGLLPCGQTVVVFGDSFGPDDQF